MLVYVRELPLDSPLGRALHGASAQWSLDTYLLATVADAVIGANWQRAGGKSTKPKPIPRPDPRTEKRRREYVDRLRRRGHISSRG